MFKWNKHVTLPPLKMQEESWRQRENLISCKRSLRKQTLGHTCTYADCAAMLKTTRCDVQGFNHWQIFLYKINMIKPACNETLPHTKESFQTNATKIMINLTLTLKQFSARSWKNVIAATLFKTPFRWLCW